MKTSDQALHLSSRMIVSTDFDEEISQIERDSEGRLVRQYRRDSFKMDDTREVIAESYIAGDIPKTLILAGGEYRKEAQNALLKILEEPPGNVIYILLSNSKASILPTIRSRLPVIYRPQPRQHVELSIDPSRLDLAKLIDEAKNVQKMSKEEAKAYVQTLYFEVLRRNMKLGQKELERFSLALRMLDLNERPQSVILSLLIMLQRQGR